MIFKFKLIFFLVQVSVYMFLLWSASTLWTESYDVDEFSIDPVDFVVEEQCSSI